MKLRLKTTLALLLSASISTVVLAQTPSPFEKKVPIPSVGDSPQDPGPLAKDLSGAIEPAPVRAAMKKVADWQLARIQDKPSKDWTYATLYAGFLAASSTLHDPQYADYVQHLGEQWNWTLGPRRIHADDQAIGQSYLALYRLHHDPAMIAPLRTQFDQIMTEPDDPNKPVWWWCDALFMAPPVWAGLSQVTHDLKYDAYMDHEWRITDGLLWNKENHLFFRDATYFAKREKNGEPIFWSRGNGWVMGGLVRVLDVLPKSDPSYAFYQERYKEMAAEIVKLQRPDGLWSPGLLDNADYSLPEVSGSAFFVYALAWGIDHHQLDNRTYGPVVARAWKAMVTQHIYADGRLGCVQPVGAAPGAFTAGSSFVFGTGAFLMAGSEVEKLASGRGK
jgi:unsaturated rhamnogalacturonyl hydrolase